VIAAKGHAAMLWVTGCRSLWQSFQRQLARIGEQVMLPEILRRARSGNFSYYLHFERLALALVMLMLSIIVVYAIALAAIQLFSDMLVGESFLDKSALQDTFGLILTILILLEFNHSVYVALAHRSGAIQARLLVLITILVVARKLMLIDFTSIEVQTLLGFSGLLLALGGLYWLISNSDRRRSEVLADAREAAAPLDHAP
jgi:uncharacterized membrane protein (DUF373 family)